MNRRDFLRSALALGATLAIPVEKIEAVVAAMTDEQIALGPPTISTFAELLKVYMPEELLREEMMRRDTLFGKLPQETSWRGGVVTLPFTKG